jgi:predicted ABC-type transport system involved in lysophospholipase L1 biosynthesis ATPase subunit
MLRLVTSWSIDTLMPIKRIAFIRRFVGRISYQTEKNEITVHGNIDLPVMDDEIVGVVASSRAGCSILIILFDSN